MTGLSAQTTHDVELYSDRVIKRYKAWGRQEPERERTALELLATYAPGLAPTFIEAGEEAGRPFLVMGRLAGNLAEQPLSVAEHQQFAEALSRLHKAVPAEILATLPQRLWLREEASMSLQGLDWKSTTEQVEEVQEACLLARRWLDSAEFIEFGLAKPARVFAQADGNLANALFDEAGCRLVDFEDSGWSDEAFELADVMEHPTCWLSGMLDVELFLELSDLDVETLAAVTVARKAMAIFWLNLLLPGGPANHRNPVGSLERQARHVRELLLR